MTLPATAPRRRSSHRAALRRRIICLVACVLSAAGGACAAGGTATAAIRASTPAVTTWSPSEAPLPGSVAANPAVSVRQLVCAAPGQCVGVGGYNNSSGIGTGVIEQLRGGHWTAAKAPVPSGTSGPQKVTLTSVSCPTRYSCGISGYLGTPTTRRSELLTNVFGRWIARAAPLLPGTLADSQTLSSISCARPGRCVAVGRYQDAKGYYQGLIEVQTGFGWRAAEAPMPADVATSENPYGGLDWVSCPAAGKCITVGAYVDSHGRRELFADVLARGTWRSTRLPLPAAAAANPLAYLDYVTCLSPGRCLAVGNVNVTGGAQDGLFEHEIGGTWHAHLAPLPAGAPASADATINEASCPTIHFCAATGDYQDTDGNNMGVLETLSGGTWHAVTSPAPPTDRTNRYMETVSCPIAHWCVAGGSTNISGLLETYACGSWTVTAAPLPSPGSFAVFASTSVSCPSARMCAAFGSYLQSGTVSKEVGLLETYRG